MKINKASKVRPPRLESKTFRKWMGQLIARDDYDEMLATYLLISEAFVAQRMLDRWKDEAAKLAKNRATLEKNRTMAVDGLAEDLAETLIQWALMQLAPIEKTIENSIARCHEVIRTLRDADIVNISEHYDGTRGPRASPLDEISDLPEALAEMGPRTWRVYAAYNQKLKRLEAAAERRAAFIGTSESVTLAQVDRMQWWEFEEACGQRLKLDGCTLERVGGGSSEQGADILCKLPDGRRIVLQCKHTAKGATQSVTVLHRLNGVKEYHGAQVVVLVTNGSVSAQGRDFASVVGLPVIEREGLRRWMEWGDPLTEVLGLAA